MARSNRYRVAYFSSSIEGDEYNESLLKYIKNECYNLEIDLIIFPSRNLNSDLQHETIIREIFKFFNKDIFDGIILSSSALINYIGNDLYHELTDNFEDIPTVSIGVQNIKYPSIVNDNAIGMKLIAEHLINVHGDKEYLYISGRKSHPESNHRLNSFIKTLKENNIELNKNRILYGDFSKDCIRDLLTPFLNKKIDEKIDTIVCANDTMAKETIDILKNYGYLVPKDISVTGFDNSISANLQLPKITTINQPVELIAKESIDLILKLIEGKETNKHILKRPNLIINESCGCFIKSNIRIEAKNVFNNKNFLKSELFESLIDSDGEEFVKNIRDTLYSCNNTKSILNLRNSTLALLNSVINDIDDIGKLKILNNINIQLINLFKESEIRKLVQSHVHFKEAIVETRIHFERLLTSVDMLSLFKNIDSIFANHKIESYYILLNNNSSIEDELQMVHGVVEKVILDCSNNEYIFNTQDFIPEEYLPSKKRYTLISLPLFSLNRCFGFIVIDSANMDESFIENIHMHLSSTLMNILSLKQLKETQKLLVESEKLAFLGNLVAGLAHEVNTPLGITVTATSFYRELLYDLKVQFDKGLLTKRLISHFFIKTSETSELIQKSLNTTIELIDRFKLISTNTDFEVRTVFNLVENIVRNFEKNREYFENLNIELIIKSPEIVLIDSYPLVFEKIINNLINNSVHHGFINIQSPKIELEILKNDKNITLIYKDNGKGCDKDQITKIFNPFFTTKRSSGFTGLGLTIIYNLIHMKLKGEIICNSKNNQGLILKITVPN